MDLDAVITVRYEGNETRSMDLEVPLDLSLGKLAELLRTACWLPASYPDEGAMEVYSWSGQWVKAGSRDTLARLSCTEGAIVRFIDEMKVE